MKIVRPPKKPEITLLEAILLHKKQIEEENQKLKAEIEELYEKTTKLQELAALATKREPKRHKPD